MTTHTLKEAPKNAPLVVDGAMQATVRYDLEPTIRPGDTLVLVDAEDGDEIARREVKSVAETTVKDAVGVMSRLDYEYHHNSPMSLMRALQGHYSPAVGLESRVDVIMFEGPSGGGRP